MSLTVEETEFVLEYFFLCAKKKEMVQESKLIAFNCEASKLYNALKRTFSHLDDLKKEECPKELIELTLARLKLL